MTDDFTDVKRRDPRYGLYDYEGKTYWIRGHEHGPSCAAFHQLAGDRWVYVAE
jgi:hypothetical protein